MTHLKLKCPYSKQCSCYTDQLMNDIQGKDKCLGIEIQETSKLSLWTEFSL